MRRSAAGDEEVWAIIVWKNKHTKQKANKDEAVRFIDPPLDMYQKNLLIKFCLEETAHQLAKRAADW
jgi:hypothetical protein